MAKILGLLGFFLVTGTIAAVIDVNVDTQVLNPNTINLNTTTYNCRGYSQACFDCQTIAYCQVNAANNATTFLMADSCGGSTPYCNETTRTCQATVSQTCLQTMNCTSYGVTFPIPNACNSFLRCFSNGTQQMGTCTNSSLPFYSSLTNSCQKTPTTCGVTCPSTSQVNVAIPYDNRYYAVCMNGLPRLVYRCRPPTTFQPSLGYCSTPCSGVSISANPNDCRTFLTCSSTSKVAVAQSCPPGFLFDLNSYECANSTGSPTPYTVLPCVS